MENRSVTGRKIALITGGSSGAGQEFARQIDKRYPEIEEFWLIARRLPRMEAFVPQLSRPSRLFGIDLIDEGQKAELWNALESERPDIRILVNNAGYGKAGRFTESSEADNLGMVDLNCRALIQLCQRCLPFMREGGMILNIASVAAFLPQPQFAIYAASKSMVVSFSRALARELRPRGITVTSVCPNPMETEFFQVAGSRGGKKTIKDLGIESVEGMVSKALRRADQGRDMSISAWQAHAIYILSRILPHRFILWVMVRSGLLFETS